MTKVLIYTDGSCLGNPGAGGWGAILKCGDMEKEICGGAAETTNNRMELMAVLNALSHLKQPSDITLYSDSQYIINAFNKGWLTSWKRNGWKKGDGMPVINRDLWQTIDLLTQKHSIAWVWVKGHADNAYNNRCDKLARSTAAKYASGELPSADTLQPQAAEPSVEEFEAWEGTCGEQIELPGLEAELQEPSIPDTKPENYDAHALLAVFDLYVQEQSMLNTGLTHPCGAYSWCQYCREQMPVEGVPMCALALIDSNQSGGGR